MNKFDAKEKAEKKVAELNKAKPQSLCPLTRGNCVTRCVCFTEAYMIPSKKYEKGKSSATEVKPFTVYDPACGNMMFFRECQNG